MGCGAADKAVAVPVEESHCHSAPDEEEVVPGGEVGEVRDTHSYAVEGRRGMQVVAKACHSLSDQLEVRYEVNGPHNHLDAGHTQSATLARAVAEQAEEEPAKLVGVGLDEYGEREPPNVA